MSEKQRPTVVDLKSNSAADVVAKTVLDGDLSKLSSEEKVRYHNAICSSVGLNPLTKPFEYIKLNGKLRLYALKNATDQLRQVHKVSIRVTDRTIADGMCIVTVEASLPDGRTDADLGIVAIANLKGEMLANAVMKAVTKAKRRVTLGICGLSMLDETEVETIPGAEKPRDVTPPQNGARKAQERLEQFAPQPEAKKETAKTEAPVADSVPISDLPTIQHLESELAACEWSSQVKDVAGQFKETFDKEEDQQVVDFARHLVVARLDDCMKNEKEKGLDAYGDPQNEFEFTGS